MTRLGEKSTSYPGPSANLIVQPADLYGFPVRGSPGFRPKPHSRWIGKTADKDRGIAILSIGHRKSG